MKKVHLLSLVFLIITLPLFPQNKCLNFDGTDDYVSCGVIDLSNSSFTIEGWFKADNLPGSGNYDHLFGIETGVDAALLRINGTNNKLEFVIGHTAGAKTLASSTVISANKWYHAAIHYDYTSGYMRIIINGVVDATWADAYSDNSYNYSNHTFTIGGNSTSRYFDGQIDEVKVWKNLTLGNNRTEATIRADMHKEIAGNESYLIAYYPLNETTGTSTNDAQTSSTYDGTLTNMAGTEWITSSAFFGPKNCLHFDGVDDNVWCSSFTPTLTQATIEFWINPDGLPDDNARLISRSATYADGDEVYLISGDGRIATTGSFVSGDDLLSTSALSIGVWTHVAITADGTGSKLYINGVLDDVGGIASFSYNTFRIGGQYTASIWETFDGKMDEVRVWSDVRTQTEILDNMNKTLAGNETGLVAYYNFDNTSGATLQNFTGNVNNGSVGGGPSWTSSTAFNTWLNTDDADWTTSSSWSNGVPGSTDNIGIYSYSGGSDVNISGTPTVNNLVIGSSAALAVSSDANVNGNLILLSDVDLNGNTITIANSGMLIENGGLLSGSSGYSTFTETLSNITSENIGGLGAEVTSSADLGSTVVERYHSAITGPTADEGINRYYKIIPTTNTGLNATLVFNYDESELNGLTESNLKLYKSTDSGSTWTEEGGTVNTTDNTITLSGIDGFSWWTAAESGSTLPVELLSFTANCKTDKTIELNWTTASETDNSHFEIQKSADNLEFNTIGKVDGSGNSNTKKYYKFTTNENENINNYFRLKQIDFDGKFEYTNTISVNCNNKQSNIEVYPNPFKNEINIDFNIPTKAKVIIEIRNILGVIISKEEIERNSLNHTIMLNGIPAGIYFIIVSNEEETIVQKLVKE